MKATTSVSEAMDSAAAASQSILHDFRSPLAAIRAGSEILIRPGLTVLQIQRVARNVQVASLRMQELLDELFAHHKETAKDNPSTTDHAETA